MARRRQLPGLRGPIPHAGGWGLPGPGITRPRTASLEDYRGLQRFAIRTGEGTASGIIPMSGQLTLSIGPDGLNVWYVVYAAIATTSGAADVSTAQVSVGPIGAGLAPGGQSYAGGGDSVGLGNQALRPGDYVSVTWSGGTPGDTAMVTVYGVQDVPV
jgi:hypothetical protein